MKLSNKTLVLIVAVILVLAVAAVLVVGLDFRRVLCRFRYISWYEAVRVPGTAGA